MSPGKDLAALLTALAAVALLALAPRTIQGLARPRGPSPAQSWYSIDPDGLYHTRRVERAFQEGLPVAGSDPYLDFPHGAAIPWPPYYDTALHLALRPFAPQDIELRRPWLERAVATLPVAFGILTALLVSSAAWWLVRGRAGPWQRAGVAAFAGIYAASSWGAVNYSRIGTGDHHAWVGMLYAASLLCASIAFGSALRSTRRALAWGAVCGLLAGLMLGSWVAALEYVALTELALGWLLVRRSQEELPGVGVLGLSYHVAALATLAPGVLASPWKDELPWVLVNLSWFHFAWLLAGALVFLPPVLLGRGALSAGRPAARSYPFAAAGVIVLVAALAWLADTAPARGVAEGLAWISRADSFMDTVRESGPLVGSRAPAEELFVALGIGALLLPFAWAAATWRAARSRLDVLVPWVVAAPVLLAQALAQKRFSDAALLPMGVLLSVEGARWLARWPARTALPLACALALLAQFPTVRRVLPLLMRGPDPAWGGPEDAVLGERTAIEWLRTRTDPGAGSAVLAHWDRGHVIEWAADRPTVATNFGSYVGVDSYRDPARFFLQDDPHAAEALLVARRVGHVLVPAAMPLYSASMCRIAGLPEALYLAGPSVFTPLWERTMLARLVDGGRAPAGSQGALDFLRLVHASTRRDASFRDRSSGRAQPAAFVWERVAGAVLEWRGAPDERLEVTIEVDFPPAGYTLLWRSSAGADEEGVARLRVPYSSNVANGDGQVLRARWEAAGRGGNLSVPEAAVLAGTTILLE